MISYVERRLFLCSFIDAQHYAELNILCMLVSIWQTIIPISAALNGLLIRIITISHIEDK